MPGDPLDGRIVAAGRELARAAEISVEQIVALVVGAAGGVDGGRALGDGRPSAVSVELAHTLVELPRATGDLRRGRRRRRRVRSVIAPRGRFTLPGEPPLLDVIAAALDACADPAFNLLGVAATTGAASPLVVVHGGAAVRLGLHAGAGGMGPGGHRNGPVGRAVRLALQNIGCARPGEADMATLGHPGKVSWLVVPNCFHHLGTPAAAAAFPEAKILGPKSAAARNPALRIDVDIHDPKFIEAVPEFALFPLAGVPFLDETLLYHRPTETLFGADAVLRADEADHWSWRFAARITGCFKRLSVPPDVRKKVVDKEAASRSLRAIQALPIKRLIVAHGDVIEQEPLAQLVEAWRLVGVG